MATILLQDKSTIIGTVRRISEHVVEVLGESLPESDALFGFRILRDNGKDTLFDGSEYATLYQTIEGGYQLSNDGSVYTEPEPTADESIELTLDELKALKKQEISDACESTIANGVDVPLSSGTEHFALTTNDQINLIASRVSMASGETQIAYHQDGQPCRYYTVEEMTLIIQQTVFWVSYHRTYCNSLNMWIEAVSTKEMLNDIYYGADIPESYQSQVLKDYLAQIMASATSGGDSNNG